MTYFVTCPQCDHHRNFGDSNPLHVFYRLRCPVCDVQFDVTSPRVLGIEAGAEALLEVARSVQQLNTKPSAGQ